MDPCLKLHSIGLKEETDLQSWLQALQGYMDCMAYGICCIYMLHVNPGAELDLKSTPVRQDESALISGHLNVSNL